MPPKAAAGAADAPTEEWEAGASSFFGDFDGGDGPSKRKQGRTLAKREERTGKSLEEEAMDPVVSAAEAKKKIANLVRARAGLKPLNADVDGPSQQGGDGVHLSKKARVDAKFDRKEQRKEDAKIDAKKNRRLNTKMAAQERFRRR